MIMNSAINEINTGSVVTLHLSITLGDGTVAFSTFDEESLTITLGDGTLREGMEMALVGLQVDEEQSLTLSPEQAYGYQDEALVQQVPLTDFSADLTPAVGQIIGFELPNGEETAGAVMAVSDTEATIDFNHPLAGKDILFTVKILSVDNKQIN